MLREQVDQNQATTTGPDGLKAYLVFGASGPVLALTGFDVSGKPESLRRLAAKTSNKFIAHEVPMEVIKKSYSAHLAHVLEDPHQPGDVKILDADGKAIFTNIGFKSLSSPIYYDPD